MIPLPERYRGLQVSMLLVCSFMLALVGCSNSSAAGPESATILASTNGSLKDSFPLDGRAVSGELHVFVEGAAGSTDFVEFVVASGSGSGRMIRRDYDAPYTPTPDGTPMNMDDFGTGKHVLLASMRSADGSTSSTRAEFLVAAPSDAPAPQPAPPREPEPAVWQPRPGTSWQWQLTGKLDMSVDAEVFDIDLEGTSAATIAQLHAAGRRVICYFSAGSFEPWRGDAAAFPPSVKGKKMHGWDELWLDIREIELLAPVMLARMDMAAAKGCDAVEPDNIDAYQNDSGFPLQASDQLAYNRWLADAAHERGLAIALKNDLGQVEELVDHFDFAINEECFAWNECERLLPFIEAGKAVFGTEYDLDPSEFCARANAMDMDFIHKELNLGAYRRSCR